MWLMMRVARAMYFESSELAEVETPVPARILLGVCAAGLIVLFIGWGTLNDLTNQLLSGIFG